MKIKKSISKPILAAGAVSVVALGTVAGSSLVTAAAPDSSQGGQAGLVDQIATKFHLNKSDVQAVFDQNRAEHQADRQKKLESRLDQAVKDGKITSDQKTQILAKLDELKQYHDSIKDKSRQEQHKLMKAKLDDLKTWAQQNDIPLQYVMPRHGGPGGQEGSGKPGQM